MERKLPDIYHTSRQEASAQNRKEEILLNPFHSSAPVKMNEQLQLVSEAMDRARAMKASTLPIDISVARVYGDSTVTMRTQVAPGAPAPHMMRSAPPMPAPTFSTLEDAPPGSDHHHVSLESAGVSRAQTGGVGRTHTTMSFFDQGEEVRLSGTRKS